MRFKSPEKADYRRRRETEVGRRRTPEQATIQAAREAYFAGEITAEEYLHRVLPASEPRPSPKEVERPANRQLHRMRPSLNEKRQLG